MKKKEWSIVVAGGVVVSLFAFGAGIRNKRKLEKEHEKVISLEKRADKFDMYYYTLLQWLQMYHGGRTIQRYCKENGYIRIAIYGLGELGVQLIDELMNSEIEIVYIVDKNPQNCNSLSYKELKIIPLEELQDDVDLVIVTPVYNYEEIKKDISMYAQTITISLLEMIETVNALY